MTLQENVFMTDLIKRNYRRRANFELFGFLWISISYVVIFVINLFSVNSVLNLFIIVLGGVNILIFMFLILLFDKPAGLKNLSARGIKEAQLRALQKNRNNEFKELQHCIPLQEYFDI